MYTKPGDPCVGCGGFIECPENNLARLSFGPSFGSFSCGSVAMAGLSENFVASDLTVVGSLAGGGDLGDVDLIYFPEPCSFMLALIGLAGFTMGGRRRC